MADVTEITRNCSVVRRSCPVAAVGGDDRFTLDVDPGQGLATPLQLTVQLQDGTLLINRQGDLLESSAIQAGRLVTATSSNGSSEQISLSQLTPGQAASVYGSEALDGCFDADTIIAFDAGSL